MIKVFQDRFGKGGNCQSAVLASLFELPLSEVPYFAEGLGEECTLSEVEKAVIFNDRIEAWLYEVGKGQYELNWYTDSPEIRRYIKEDCIGIPYQVSGKSPRGYVHVVIYVDGEMVHDPHPEGGGVVETWFGFIGSVISA